MRAGVNSPGYDAEIGDLGTRKRIWRNSGTYLTSVSAETGEAQTRYVSANGGIRWNSQWVCVSTVCAGEYVGLEEIDNGIWNVYFGALKLGRLLERHMQIEDAYGRLKRHDW